MLRVRREDDLERCVALLREVYEADRYPIVWPANPLSWLVGRDPLTAWIDEHEDGRLLGHLSLHRTDGRARPAWRDALGLPVDRLAVVSRLFVSPAARGRGIGAALMDRAEAHAAQHRLGLALDVAEHNRDAIAFYTHRGWTPVGNAHLPLSGPPWRLGLVLFVLV